MNKRMIALLLVNIMLMMLVACGKNKTATETTGATDNTEVTEMEVPTESIGGVVYNPNGNDGNIDEDEVMPDETEPSEKETQAATLPQDDENKDATTPSTGPVEENTTPSKPVESMTEYERYMAMSGEEQVEFYNTFDSAEDFIAWFNAAKAEYEEKNPSIDVGDGIIDAEDLINGNG